MPRRTKKVVYRRKRKPRFKKKAKSMYTQSANTPLGKSLKSQTRYFEKGLALSPPAAGNSARYVFSANGLYDPNVTGVGHQPIGFDQLMQMFDHYTVIGSRLRVDFNNNDPVNSVIVGIHLNDDKTPSLDPAITIENGSAKYTTLTPSGGDKSHTTMTLKCSPAKYLGRSRPLSDPELKGNVNQNPIEGVFYNIFACDNGFGDPTTVDFNVTLEYLVIYHEPKQLALS